MKDISNAIRRFEDANPGLSGGVFWGGVVGVVAGIGSGHMIASLVLCIAGATAIGAIADRLFASAQDA
ncbi:MAG: hypothetical protein RLY93_13690 [Sumerlaeia bacterium]